MGISHMEKSKKEDDRAQELTNEYKEKRPLFQKYTKTIRFLLESLLRKHDVQFQTVQFRTKEVPKFHRKLLKKKHLQSKKLTEITDLSGCRVIFYVEEALDNFARILYDEFEVVEDEVKISPDEYNAWHIVVKLKENRLSLPEYSGFRELRCEIQLTTMLYHAWSEIQHDIIYKQNEQLLEFDKPAFDYIRSYFNEIMEKHLKEASTGFSFILYEFNKIRRGQAIINPLTIDAVSRSTSNNELYGFLKLLHEYVAKYAEKLPRDYRLIDSLESALSSAEKNPVIGRKTIFGDLKGITYLDIADVVLDIMDSLRYYDIPDKLSLLIRLGKHKELQRKSEETLGRTVAYSIEIVNKYGFYVQETALDWVSKQTHEYTLENLDLVLASLRPIASLECEDWVMSTSETVTFKRVCLKPTPALGGIRTRYFELMTKFAQLVKTNVDKRKVLSTMFSLVDQPQSEQMSEDIAAFLSADIVKITDFLITRYDSMPNVVKKDIQRFVFSLERRPFKERFVNLNRLKEKLDQDVNYARFRIFYGNDVDFYPSFDYEAAQGFRKQKIEEFVQEINEENLEDWLVLFRELLVSYGPDVGSMYFSMFLRRLGQQKPAIAFRLLDIENLSPFLGSILGGLIESSEQERVKKLLIDCSKEKTKQLATAQTILSKKDYDDTLFGELYPNLLETTDPAVLLILLQTIVSNYSTHKDQKEKATAIINKFTTLGFFSWSFVYHMSSDFWKEMSDENAAAVLQNLRYCSNIGYDEECMLSSIAEKNPKAIISLFHDRVELSRTKKISDPIPFRSLVIGASLSKNHEEILPEIVKWFSKEDPLTNWYASQLIGNIFPSFGPDLESFLLHLVRKNDKKDLEIVLRILDRYGGQPFLHNSIKEIIRLCPMDETLRTTLCQILSQIKGAVMGEYGFLEIYKLKKKETEGWLTDSNAEIRGFGVEYHRHLDGLINKEKARADKETAFRKREFEIAHK
jgi:ppGpp synthetase/RelA/SpoT-type nucleotidyltranferase